MPRRAPYTRVVKLDQERPAHVDGQGDVVHRRYQCLAPDCAATHVVPDADCVPGFSFTCAVCGHVLFDGGEDVRFHYDVRESATDRTLGKGPFAVSHQDHLDAAERVKHCLLCYALLPLSAFGHHAARESGRQGECRNCKRLYNSLKNHTRLPEQHREAADNRRLLLEVAGERKLEDLNALYDRFGGACFCCGRELTARPGGDDGYHLDHTLPVAWLWPIQHGPTVLCRTCNGRKADRWPAPFYEDDAKLRRLAVLTGIAFEALAGEPFFCPEAVDRLLQAPDAVIERWAAYPARLRALRTRILHRSGIDVFADASQTARRAIGLAD